MYLDFFGGWMDTFLRFTIQNYGTYVQQKKNWALLAYYAASSFNFLLTFRDKQSIPSSGFKNPKRRQQIATTRCVITQKIEFLIYFAAET